MGATREPPPDRSGARGGASIDRAGRAVRRRALDARSGPRAGAGVLATTARPAAQAQAEADGPIVTACRKRLPTPFLRPFFEGLTPVSEGFRRKDSRPLLPLRAPTPFVARAPLADEGQRPPPVWIRSIQALRLSMVVSARRRVARRRVAPRSATLVR